MSYSIKEIYYTLQGEGYNTGKPAIFIRFSGCNLWTGFENNRNNAICKFCDTDFVGVDGENGGKYSNPSEITSIVISLWPKMSSWDINPFIICTGGEPLLQLDEPLLDEFHDNNFIVAVETNGTIIPPDEIDWLTVSPKINAKMVLDHGDELKVVFPQSGLDLQSYETLDFKHFFLQPMDNESLSKNTKISIDYCMKNPKWRLSLQTHKYIGMP